MNKGRRLYFSPLSGPRNDTSFIDFFYFTLSLQGDKVKKGNMFTEFRHTLDFLNWL